MPAAADDLRDTVVGQTTRLLGLAEHWAWTRQTRRFVHRLTGRLPPPDWTNGVAIHRLRWPKEAVLYAVTRALRPSVIVETGVCHGWSSRAFLAALHDMDLGRLYSVDLPSLGEGGPPHVTSSAETGREVPAYLKDRWSLVLGPSTEHLPGILTKFGPVDLFHHDSDHSYAGQRWEYDVAWPSLRPGGVLMSDDTNDSPAFREFARAHARPSETAYFHGGTTEYLTAGADVVAGVRKT